MLTFGYKNLVNSSVESILAFGPAPCNGQKIRW